MIYLFSRSACPNLIYVEIKCVGEGTVDDYSARLWIAVFVADWFLIPLVLASDTWSFLRPVAQVLLESGWGRLLLFIKYYSLVRPVGPA